MPAGTISQRIALEGADDIIQKLQAVGLTGEEAFKKLQNATSTIGKGISEVPEAFGKIKEGITGVAGEAQKLVGSFSGFGAAAGAITSLAARFGPLGIAAAAVGGGILELVKGASDAVVANQRMAESLGLTLSQYKGLKLAAHEAGASTEELNTGLRRFATQAAAEGQSQFKGLINLTKDFSKTLPGGSIVDRIINIKDLDKIREAAAKLAPQVKAQLQEIGSPQGNIPVKALESQLFQRGRADPAFRKQMEEATGGDVAVTQFEKLGELVKKREADFHSLGLSLLDTKGKALGTFDSLVKAAKAIGEMPAGPQKTATAQKLFTREAGPALIPFFDEMAKGNKTADEIQAKFKAVDASLVADAMAAKRAFDQLGETWEELKTKFAIKLAPLSTDFITSFTTELKTNVGIAEQNLERLKTIAESFKSGISNTPGFGGGLTEIGKGAGGSKPEDNNAGLPDATLLGGAGGGLVIGNLIRAFRDGGRIRGPGTGTSDSILALLSGGGAIRVSNGEYINDQHTVSKLGVPFFANLKHLARGMASGGLIGDMFEMPRFGGSIPSFAGGGMASGGGSPVHIHFPDGNKFTTHASASVADSLGRYSVHKQLSRAGRSPSWAGL